LIDALQLWNSGGAPAAFWALRDGVCVGYAVFSIAGVPVLASATSNAARRLTLLLGWMALPALLWILLTINDKWPTTLDYFILNRKVDMLSLSVAVSAWVLGVLAFYELREKSGSSRRHNSILLLLAAGLCAAVALRIPIRAAWIAAVVLLLAMLLLTFPRWVKWYVLAAIATAAILIWTVALPYIQNNNTVLAERVRVTLFGGNVHELKTEEGKNALLHKEWRSIFWKRCIEETSQKSPVFGLGFGSNLTELLQTTREWWRYVESQQLNPPNRSPHNATITVYARMGLIGLALWLMIIVGTFVRGLRFCRSGIGTSAPDYYAGLTIFGTWIIYLCYMSVGVVLENPFGGIWFWFLTGTLQALPPAIPENSR
jgi:O-antigen ligase